MFCAVVGWRGRRAGSCPVAVATTPDDLGCPCSAAPQSRPAASSSATATPRLNPLSSARPSDGLLGPPRSNPSAPAPQSPIAEEQLHPHHQVGLGRFDDQVKVIAHQALRVCLPTGLLTSLGQRLQQPLPVLVILKDRLPPAAPIHYVINCPSILNAQLPSHEPCLASPRPLAQAKQWHLIN